MVCGTRRGNVPARRHEPQRRHDLTLSKYEAKDATLVEARLFHERLCHEAYSTMSKW